MDDMNNSRRYELKPQDVMNNSWLRMILMIIGREPMALIAVNSSKLWMTLTTLGHELKAQGSRCYEQLRAMYDMNNFGLWA